MNYDHTITLIVPLDALDIAKRVSRALDPDVGGYDAFQSRVTKAGVEFASYSTSCVASFAQNAAMLLAIPEELYAMVSADYASRWPDLECPTLEECTALCSVIECYVDCQAEGYEQVVPVTSM
jgi:hypothetical protein